MAVITVRNVLYTMSTRLSHSTPPKPAVSKNVFLPQVAFSSPTHPHQIGVTNSIFGLHRTFTLRHYFFFVSRSLITSVMFLEQTTKYFSSDTSCAMTIGVRPTETGPRMAHAVANVLRLTQWARSFFM